MAEPIGDELGDEAGDPSLVLGEFRRTLDDRFRLSLPVQLLKPWGGDRASEVVLAKERPGCVSLWPAETWNEQLAAGLEVVRSKIRARRLSGQAAQVQALGRLLSTRHRVVRLAGRGRIVIPEGFREFLQADGGSEVMVVGAAVCVEIWHVPAWQDCLREEIPGFTQLLDELSR